MYKRNSGIFLQVRIIFRLDPSKQHKCGLHITCTGCY